MEVYFGRAFVCRALGASHDGFPVEDLRVADGSEVEERGVGLGGVEVEFIQEAFCGGCGAGVGRGRGWRGHLWGGCCCSL
jgi:hypothetical protein